MTSFKCVDIGMKNDPFEIKTATKDELMAELAIHAKTVHGMEKMTPELAKQIDKAIKP
jgi:predicted small metal-binding protein